MALRDFFLEGVFEVGLGVLSGVNRVPAGPLG